jgi:SRSO17 transposase
MERYVTGLLTDLPHKTCDTIADVIAGTSSERLQHLLTDAAWDPLQLDERRAKRLLELHAVPDGILVYDDTGLPKKGSASVGVAAQYSGTLGKIGNCQVVVSAEYLADDPASSTPFHFPLSAHLFLPESWTQDAERRKQAQVPEEISQQTKPEIALGLLDRARHWGVPIGAVVVDAGYGDNPNFLRGLDERQIPYICAVESTFGCRLPDEVQAIALQPAVYQGRGQPRKPRSAPLYTVKELIAALPASAWRTISWREGTKGTMQVQAVAMRVHWATGSSLHSTSHSRVHTAPEGWLLAERPVPGTVADDLHPSPTEPQEQEEEQIKYWFSVLPQETSLQRLILLAHARWVIEQFYEDAKQEWGLDDYQGRSWQGLHRHVALVMLPLPPEEAFSPCRHAKLAAFRTSADAPLAVPGSRPLAPSDQAHPKVPSSEKLTK